MAYPSDSQPKTELLINGTWTDISTRVRGESKITITRGRVNEQGRVSAQRANLTINNRDGLFSTRNPNSIYYGLLPRNTQVRIAAGTGDNYLKMFSEDTSSGLNYAYVADKASLDIVGDIEVRADVRPHTWRPETFTILASKWALGSNQRSWVLYMDQQGYLKFRWSTDGTTTNQQTATSTSPVPVTSGRLSVKATLDVNNGAAGWTVAFSTSATIGGTYAALGSSVTAAGVTSIFSSSAGLVTGSGWDTSGVFTDGATFGGRFYGLQVYTGIAGTLVANADFSARSVGDTTWADSVPSTWTLFGNVRITSDRLRFWGELSTLPQYWDKSGHDVFVPVTGSGMIRRLTQGASPLRSPMYRNFTQYSPNGYWPFEDDFRAVSAASAVSGAGNAVTTNVTYAADNGLPGAVTSMQMVDATSRVKGSAVKATATNFASFVLYIKVDALPASGTPGFISIYTTGGVCARIDVGLTATTWVLNYYGTDGSLLLNSNVSNTGISPKGQFVGFNILLTKSGGNVQTSVRWDTAGADAGGVGPTTLAAGNVGYFSRFTGGAGGDVTFQTMRWSHLFMSNQNLNLTTQAFRQASIAYLGERAITRLRRLALEEAVPVEISGYAADSEAMGYQTTSTFMDLAYEVADADQGMLAESRDSLALFYRSRVDLENRNDLSLSERLFHLSEVPVAPEDDSGLVNDVTVTSGTGSSGRATIDTGSLSTLAPPNGVGRYDTSIEVNAQDGRLQDIAQWKAFVGTWDEPRFPSLAVGLHRASFVASAALSLATAQIDVGDTITLTGLPAWMPPDDVLLLTQGYTEVLWKLTWDITFNTTPAGPYRLPVAGSDFFVPRLDATTTFVKTGVTSSATAIVFRTPVGSAAWVDSTSYPAELSGGFPIKVAGESMLLTAMTAPTIVSGFYEQTATVTRSLNAIVKAQLANTSVYLLQPTYASL